ncbi:plasmid partitioning protein RepB [Allomesorhizobium alhagi]|uniref:Replication protein B n=1 Tax=Mesorhizobium alhagi CCNWXJ12-2 TaxID=1107882 RepID=H0I138_9HYPH|nr:plasmid partitioning protein RepB [Mesorhizobium alhagi]EHK53285.1 replication protein B [Mesorhizobium alhagi CCNWXJ12-2]
MARKNIFEVSPERAGTDPEPAPTPLARPLLGLERPLRPASPVGAISQSLENINSRAHRAEEIERKLAEGQAVVELEPDLVDGSFVPDRLEVDPDDVSSLVAQIREHGQQVPILVRPNPELEGRYQVAYGHRRLAAAKELGLKVRAVVRQLTDEQLIVSQGQENNARTDLSFIERSFFATRLEDKGFSRDTIMASLGVDKAALSRMIALIRRLPPELIEAVGPSPAFGRQRWAELADLLDEKGKRAKALKLIGEQDFSAQKSDARFQALYDHLKIKRQKPQTEAWKASDGARPVRIVETEDKVSIVFDKIVEPEFGPYVRLRLQTLYDEFKTGKSTTKPGD